MTMITLNEIMAMMEEASGKPPPNLVNLAPEDANMILRHISTKLSEMADSLYSDLGVMTSMLEQLDQHLMTVQHEATSDCWAKRAAMLQMSGIAQDKIDRLESCMAAIGQYLRGGELS